MSSPAPLASLYSTISGASVDILSETALESPPAFENKFKYLAAKLKLTGSSMSKITFSVSLPESFCERTEFPVPIYPVIENLIWSLLVSILIVSDNEPYSLQILLNSLDGKETIDANSVSGMPKVSESRFIRDKLNSDILSPPNLNTDLTLRFKFEAQT